ncbi:MAG: hypothetical protein Kow006_15000 [Gammaproteobacteria bacterium]
MTAQEKPGNDRLVQCEICLKEVPSSEAHVAEAEDYVINFCGLDCYEKWIRKAENEKKSKE